ncbi:MAG: zf-HC2 domain-containing protein, partial [Chloroflexi bacterium]|nr:zf-HC2 domain-containing protein [Chloroflexota bacterium]
MKSNRETACEKIEELLEAYALGALEPDERQLVERHLSDCPKCRQLLAEYEEMVAMLPEALAAVSPQQAPDTLKAELLRRLESDSQATERGPAARPVSPERDGGRQWAWRRPPWWRLQLITAAFAILLVVSLVWGIRLNVALAQERALRAEVTGVVGQQELVLEIIDSNQTERRFLRSFDSSSDAYGKLFTR